jgi:heme/copper-type cytochrome/quinol oxidase subunit 2
MLGTYICLCGPDYTGADCSVIEPEPTSVPTTLVAVVFIVVILIVILLATVLIIVVVCVLVSRRRKERIGSYSPAAEELRPEIEHEDHTHRERERLI